MLDARINSMVLRHFKVITPDRPHTQLNLNDLIYSDYGFSSYYGPEKGRRKVSLAIRLEQMRAHVMRTTPPPPDKYKEKVFSVILYGPPQTGKTTLAEALALSSDAPLVMLSPSDLVVEGQEAIEGRARGVFEALGMLTRAVILLDEFEAILHRRTTPEKQPDIATSDRGKNDSDAESKQPRSESIEDLPALAGIGKRIETLVDKCIVRSDDPPSSSSPTLRFLLAGMLPKLIELHEAAKKRSLVYLLATNHVDEIDLAAKRPERFDVHLPVYHPDPLSRAGTFLYRLQRIPKMAKQLPEKGWANRLLEIVTKSAGVPASTLALDYNLPKWAINGPVPPPDDWEKDVPPLFLYVRDARKPEVEEMAIKQPRDTPILDDDERAERAWLSKYEEHVKEVHRNSLSRDFGVPGGCLARGFERTPSVAMIRPS